MRQKPNLLRQKRSDSRLALFFLLGFAPAGCALLHKGHKPAAPPSAQAEPPAAEEVSSDPEVGIAHLHALMRCFDAAVEQKEFTAAQDCLQHAEHGVLRSNTPTRGHPDFDDLADRVQHARSRLNGAIEQDRIQTRNAAIDRLIAQSDAALNQAHSLCLTAARPVPSAEDTQALQVEEATLDQLLQQGQGFLDAPRYRTEAENLKKAKDSVHQLYVTNTWQLNLSKQLAPVLDAGFAAATAAKTQTDPSIQLEAYQKVGAAFAQCLQLLEAAKTEPGFSEGLLIDSRMGQFNSVQLHGQCATVLGQANDRVNRFGWEHLLAQLNTAYPAVQQQGSRALQALTATLPLLSACAEAAPGQPQAKGSDTWLFDSPFGRLNLVAIQKKCAKALADLELRQPILLWQSRLEAAAQHLADAQVTLGGIVATSSADAQLAALGHASGDLSECFEGAHFLQQEPHTEKHFKVATSQGDRDVGQLLKICAQLQKSVQTRMQALRGDADLQKFVQTCHGDEIDVAKREGVPPQIEARSNGRIFVYKNGKQFAFDSIGRRVDPSVLH